LPKGTWEEVFLKSKTTARISYLTSMLKFKFLLRWIGLALIPATMTLQQACYYDNEQDLYGIPTPCDTLSLSYNAEIKGIITNNCQGCHNNASASGNLNLESDASRVANIAKIIERISLPANDPRVMPTSGPMPSCNIEKIKAWRNQGLSITN
jgi:hypothetical protein